MVPFFQSWVRCFVCFWSTKNTRDIDVKTFFSTSLKTLTKLSENFPRKQNFGERTRKVWQTCKQDCHVTHGSDFSSNVCQLGRIIQRIFSAQSGASPPMAVWKWSVETEFPEAIFPPLVVLPPIFARFTSSHLDYLPMGGTVNGVKLKLDPKQFHSP